MYRIWRPSCQRSFHHVTARAQLVHHLMPGSFERFDFLPVGLTVGCWTGATGGKAELGADRRTQAVSLLVFLPLSLSQPPSSPRFASLSFSSSRPACLVYRAQGVLLVDQVSQSVLAASSAALVMPVSASPSNAGRPITTLQILQPSIRVDKVSM